jgi:ribosomal protein S18 acetylase RimI-like enzyme
MLRLRPPGRADLDALAALDAACFPPADRFPRRTWAHLAGPAARAGTAETLVAAEGERLLGAVCFLLRRGAGVARLYSLAVDPTARGRGLARRLLAAAEARLPARIAVVSLEVRAANDAALGLYRALGFAVVAPLPGYYADGAAGLRLRAPRAALRSAVRHP